MTMTDTVQSKRYLFVLWDGGGNVPPQLAIVRRLVARGHEVRVLAPRVLEQRITAAGGRYVAYNRAPEHESASPERDLLQDWAAHTPLEAAARVRDRLMAGPSLVFAQDVLATLEKYPADAVVADYMVLGAFLGAERVSLPAVALIHHIYPLPAPALPPFGMGFQPATNPLGYLRDAVMGRMFRRFYEAALPRLNEARTALGLAPLTSLFDLFARLNRVLVLTSPAFDFPAAALPGNVRYVGPQLDAQPSTDWQGPWEADDRRPLIVVSLSTTFQRQGDVIHRVISALSTLPIRALVTVGPALDIQSYQTPANIMVRSYVPHQEVFPHADLVITHGGHGTVIRALACGVPVLCLPMGRDQADVAARVVWRKAGLSMSSRSKPDALRKTVMHIIDEPHFRDGAQQIAEEMAKEDGAKLTVAELEALEGARTGHFRIAPTYGS